MCSPSGSENAAKAGLPLVDTGPQHRAGSNLGNGTWHPNAIPALHSLSQNNFTVAIEDAAALRDICGANDRNVTHIADAVGAPVRTRGNELILESADDARRRLFRALLDGLLELVRDGRHPDQFNIAGVAARMNDDAEAAPAVSESPVLIPGGAERVFARSAMQMRYLDALQQAEMVVAIGPAGTGKTFLAVAAALREVLSHQRRKLVVTRPVVEAGESLGYLPGDLGQKIHPYLRPLYDAMDTLVTADAVRRLEDSRMLEVAPLAYMRGRTLANSFVILDEAQNTTREQMKMFLTRIGEGSKVVVTGDVTQVDLPRRRDSGLIHISSILTPIREIAFLRFTQEDVVRGALVRHIVQAYEQAEGAGGSATSHFPGVRAG